MQASRRSIVLQALLLGVVIVAMTSLMARFWPLGADYFYHFRPLADQWVDGYLHIYDGTQERLFYPPWSLFVIVPLGLFPLELGNGMLFTASLLGLVGSIHIYQNTVSFPAYAIFLSLANLHVFDVFIRGQIDVAMLLGLVLAWHAIRTDQPMLVGLGLTLLTVKPPLNVVLPGALYLLAIWCWQIGDRWRVFVVPTLALVISTALVGLDWPLLFANNLTSPNDYLAISLWRAASTLGLPAWIVALPAGVALLAWGRLALNEGLNQKTLAIALATNFTFTNYANGDHYILLIPALLYVAQLDRRLALLAYAATWTPLLRLSYGWDLAPLDVGFPLILLLAAWYFHWRAVTDETVAAASREAVPRTPPA